VSVVDQIHLKKEKWCNNDISATAANPSNTPHRTKLKGGRYIR